MREDYEENLQHMLKEGYIVIYIQPNGDPAYHWYNPKQDEFLEQCLALLEQSLHHEDPLEKDTEEDTDEF